MPSINGHNITVSVLICSKGRRTSLEKLVAIIQRGHSVVTPEIVVVEETDHPKPIEGTRYIAHPIAHRGIPFARNLALANAAGQIVVFVDDDCILASGWLETLIEPILEDKTVVGTQGGVTVPDASNAIGWAESLLGFPGGGITRVLQAMGNIRRTREVSTLNCAYRHSVLKKIGGFEPTLRLGGEDYLLAKQACAHGSCMFVPDALVYHKPRGSFGAVWKWFIRRGRAEIHVLRTRQPEVVTRGTVLRRSFFIKLFAVLMMGILLPYGPVVAGTVLCLVYPGIQVMRYYPWWKKSRAPRKALWVLPAVKFVMDMAMDVGRIRGIILDR